MYVDQATPLIAYTQEALLLQRKRRALESESVSGSTRTLFRTLSRTPIRTRICIHTRMQTRSTT